MVIPIWFVRKKYVHDVQCYLIGKLFVVDVQKGHSFDLAYSPIKHISRLYYQVWSYENEMLVHMLKFQKHLQNGNQVFIKQKIMG